MSYYILTSNVLNNNRLTFFKVKINSLKQKCNKIILILDKNYSAIKTISSFLKHYL